MSKAPRAAVSPINNNVAYSATSVTLFNLVRDVGFRSVMNDTDKAAYVYFSASAASTTAFTKKLAAGEYWQFPEPVYNNVCTIIGEAAGTGAYRTTEYTV